MIQDNSGAEYRCPGEAHGISRAVHLGRLASFHAACRDCPRRDDTFGLSRRVIRQLADIGKRPRQQSWFQAEGVDNVAINDLSPNLARRIAIEFARRITGPAMTSEYGERGTSISPDSNSTNREPVPRPATVVVAGDGRLAAAAIIGSIVEGIRWTGCQTIDIGTASAPCTGRAIEHLPADGGVYVGNPHGAAHTVGLKFWAHGEPLSQGGLLDEIAASVLGKSGEATIDRPSRAFGNLQRFAVADVYLSDLRPAFHALRPLRFVLDCAAGAVAAYLEQLIQNVACRIIPAENGTDRLGEQVVAAGAHFGVRLDDDGENCRLFDERGQPVAAERLLTLFAGSFAGPVMHGEQLRQKTYLRMRESGASIAADSAGRLWYASGHAPLPDALRTLTLLLVLLSRNDLPFSAVLDSGPMQKLCPD